MGVIRVVIAILVAAAIGAALTGWIINEQEAKAKLAYAFYPAPTSPIVPLGDVAGGAKAPPSAERRNPLASDPTAIAEGKKLFVSMNCAGCHGYDAKGGMGPNLTDTYWRYGGTPERVYETILNGRPQGMPAWGIAMPPQHIWQLVAYIQSLGGMIPPSRAQAAAQGDLGQNKGASDQQ
jgi:cytochrome c oxidase cbb3-type subunit III